MGSVLGAVGGIIGNQATQGTRSSADTLDANALANIENLNTPTLSTPTLQQFQVAQQLNPTFSQAATAGPSAYNQITEDPNLKNAQMSALTQLQALGRTGLSAQDVANLRQVQNSNAQQAQGKIAQIMQQQQAQGMSSAGGGLAAQLMAAQNGSNNANQSGLNIAGQANQNALNALNQSASLAGNVRGQDYSVAANKAAAQDQMNRFNTQNQQQSNMYNAQAANQTGMYNANTANTTANANTNQNNQNKVYANQLAQQNFNNQNQLAGEKSNALQGRANQFGAQADRTSAQDTAVGKGMGDGIEAIVGGM